MADKSFFGRLQTLFSTNAIVRKVGANKVKVPRPERTTSSPHVSIAISKVV